MPHYHFADGGNLIRPKESDPYDADTDMEPVTTSTPKKKVSYVYNTGVRQSFCGLITARSVQGEYFYPDSYL